MDLITIKDDIQKIIEAMAAVLNIEVTIYNFQKTVIATTGGGVHSQIGRTVRGHVISEAMRQQITIINFQPGKHEYCKPCPLWGNCPEKADISCPIVYEGQSIGTISLTAYTESQKKYIIKNSNNLKLFLEKIAELIRSKIAEEKLVRELSAFVEKLETIIYCVHEGILAIDENGKIDQLNYSAEKLLKVNQAEVKGKMVEEVLPEFPIKMVLETGEGYNNLELPIIVNGKKVYTMSTARTLKNKVKNVGVVVTLQDMRHVNRFVYEMTSYHRRCSLEDICSRSSAVLQLKNQVRLISQSDSTVLIQGESGTGKELFARAIHAEGPRKGGPFITINCAAIPDSLLESELFGYDEGAFTGARKQGKPGKFELANEGIILLDEIGDMPLHLQAKLLRVTEEQKIERVGGIRQIPLNVRIIASTNRNIEEMVTTGEFRKDLYFRLNVIPIVVPPLRERPEDIQLLVEYFLKKYRRILNKKSVTGVSQAALEVLNSYEWPGNVRELENAMEYALNIETDDLIKAESLPQRIIKSMEERVIPMNKSFSLKKNEERLIKEALNYFGHTLMGKEQAAKALGINLSTLYRNLNKYNLR